MAYEYEFLKVGIDHRLAEVTISNPPINLITLELYSELLHLTQELKDDPTIDLRLFCQLNPEGTNCIPELAPIPEVPECPN